ncbi:hypothetical protein [Hyalangium minutum]|uniref:Lipoprotein n=1 Tax=Hyalangium minutum TaxID=394096 RepID=A0A085WGI8_9BACT|nr:hypothetical protein [Hyalangium minutum]KFE66801.1 hypothetical protein DB31_9015 [Hyalangium minutum]
MPDMRALQGKMRWVLSHRLGPLALALLVGCSSSTRILRLEAEQPEPIVHIAPGDRAPVRVDSAAFLEAFSTHALQVQPAPQPLQQAQRLWLLPSRSAPYATARSRLGLVSVNTQEDMPRGHLLPETSAAEGSISRDYGLWCESRSLPLDCLQLLDGGALLSHDGKRALALHFALTSLWLETKDALEQMVDPLAIQTTLVSAMTMYLMLWVLPEPLSKGIAAAMTVALIGYLGFDTVWSLFQGWALLVEDVDKATSFDQVRDAGRRFSRVLGPNAARVFAMLFTVAAGNTAAGFASKLPSLPGAPQATLAVAIPGGTPLSLAAAVDSVTVSASGATLVLAPGAVAMASSGDTTVYISRNGGQLQYVGITNDLARRAAEQLREKGIHIEDLMNNLSREDARAVEQVLIEIHGLQKNGGTLLNRINSIARSNPKYARALRRGKELLKTLKNGDQLE